MNPQDLGGLEYMLDLALHDSVEFFRAVQE